MSRVGKNPVTVPDGTDIQIVDQLVRAKGKLGELTVTLPREVEISHEDNLIWLKPRETTKRAQAMWGTSRAILSNLVTGVSEGYSKTLEITGVGYRAAVQGKTLNLQLGFSHDINFAIPEGIEIKCENQTTIEVSGTDKQAVGQVAAEIRAFRKPEPYKGKGIRYRGEQILRKEGKKK
ncbi:MAG: 50S ribosomal protein L6 [Alphaproteobacteria bacterium]|nr:50S ribosomal protein L6 [Alphaproteobacteria bacterium]MCZ6509204.1 50S ribosomal protein L6 [Alphaproteobacteria bacterium]MCZ6586469.1 50S ribosomal protein L6 [Alphaproteobacteria bacterium]MCZ6591833.1 50S ribosomal protein L6 [Alphaproteobacteria bacterium]MCZ6840886.1 50S ribosomal protein L6 [Alphaproteobacteria bacterium]